jgi:3'-5' exonuclease
MIVIAFDLEMAPQDDALAEFVAQAEPLIRLVEGGGPFDRETVDAAVAKCSQPGLGLGDRNWKKPEAIEPFIRSQVAEIAEKASRACTFDPLRGRIVSGACALRHLKTGEMIGEVRTLADFEGDEARLVRWLWSDWLGLADCLVSWNGWAFDVPYLDVRSALLGITPPRSFEMQRGRYVPHCDLMQWFTQWDRSKQGEMGPARCRPHRAGLDAVCVTARIGESKGGMDGSQVAQLVDEGRWDEIAAYNLADVRDRTWPLYERFCRVIPGHQSMAAPLDAARKLAAKAADETAGDPAEHEEAAAA